MVNSWRRCTFQSTLPRGERRTADNHAKLFVTISIHAPTWGATVQWLVGEQKPKNFNPRSHVGSDILVVGVCAYHKQFQSTLPRGERPPHTRQGFHHHHFNPRSHVGSDLLIFLLILPNFHFNPRSHVGSDFRANCSAHNIGFVFQSTLPRGERPKLLESGKFL